MTEKAKKVSVAGVLAATITAASLLVTRQSAQPPRFALMWDYPTTMPASNIVFEVFHSMGMQPQIGWNRFAVTNAPPVGIWPTQQAEFFILRASNTATHLVSDWASK